MGMAETTAAPAPPDPFVEISLSTWNGLNDAVRECDWIADGGDPTATSAERNTANVKQAEYDREQTRVMQRLTAYLAKQLSVHPPSSADLAQSKQMATQLAQMRDVNVKVSAVISAATALLNAYGNAAGKD